MADTSKIEWTDATWNVITGCSIKSPGCKGCYAMLLAGTRLSSHPSRAGLTQVVNGNHVWTGEVRFNDQWLDQPLRWRRPRRVFVCAHGDLFHEDVPDEWIDKVFAVMALCPQHTFQVLTKRAHRMRDYFNSRTSNAHLFAWAHANEPGTMPLTQHEIEAWLSPTAHDDHRRLYHARAVRFPLPNVWLGVSIEDRPRLRERAWTLKCIPAAVHFWSVEPLIGELGQFPDDWLPDWLIVGGESGRDARPMAQDWVRSLRDQCQAAGVPFFFKQWGEYGPVDGRLALIGKKRAGRLLDGREWSEFPA